MRGIHFAMEYGMEENYNSEDPGLSRVKLFVGQVPKELIEEQLRPYFDVFGSLVEISVIRDSATNAHKGI